MPENIGAYITNCHIFTERETRRIRKAAKCRLWRQSNKERVRQSKSRWNKQRKMDKQINQHLCLFQKNQYVIFFDESHLCQDGELIRLSEIFREQSNKAYDLFQNQQGSPDKKDHTILSPFINGVTGVEEPLKIDVLVSTRDNKRKKRDGFRTITVLYDRDKCESENIMGRDLCERLSRKVANNYVHFQRDTKQLPPIKQIGFMGYGTIDNQCKQHVKGNMEKCRVGMLFNLESYDILVNFNDTSGLVVTEELFPGNVMVVSDNYLPWGSGLRNKASVRLFISYDTVTAIKPPAESKLCKANIDWCKEDPKAEKSRTVVTTMSDDSSETDLPEEDPNAEKTREEVDIMSDSSNEICDLTQDVCCDGKGSKCKIIAKGRSFNVPLLLANGKCYGPYGCIVCVNKQKTEIVITYSSEEIDRNKKHDTSTQMISYNHTIAPGETDLEFSPGRQCCGPRDTHLESSPGRQPITYTHSAYDEYSMVVLKRKTRRNDGFTHMTFLMNSDDHETLFDELTAESSMQSWIGDIKPVSGVSRRSRKKINEGGDKIPNPLPADREIDERFLSGKDSEHLLFSYPLPPSCKQIFLEKEMQQMKFACLRQVPAYTTDESWKRKQIIKIRVKDYHRLDPEVHLNDVLLEFILVW